MYNQGRNIGSNNELLRSQTSVIQSQIPEQQAVRVTLEEQIAEIEPQVEPLKTAAAGYNIMWTDLENNTERIKHEVTQIARLTPEDVALVYGGDKILGYSSPVSEGTVNHTGEVATISGKTKNLDAIFKYARDLRSIGGFSQVIISSIVAYDESVEAEEGDGEGDTLTGYNFKFIVLR
jgi:hypothetical protein